MSAEHAYSVTVPGGFSVRLDPDTYEYLNMVGPGVYSPGQLSDFFVKKMSALGLAVVNGDSVELLGSGTATKQIGKE